MKTPLSFLACVIVCMAMASCRSVHEEKASRNAGPCSPQQIMEIADAEACQRGCHPNEWVAIYDEGNAYWKSRLEEIEARRLEIDALHAKYDFIEPQPPLRIPELEGRDYQVVLYRRREIIPSGDLVIFVDRSSGEVLRVIQGG